MKRWVLTLILVLLTVACSTLGPRESQILPVTQPAATTEAAAAEPTQDSTSGQVQTASPVLTPEDTDPGWPEPVEEAVLIQQPGPGSRLVSPLHLEGLAAPSFEQTLVARLVRTDGSLLMEQPLLVAGEMGERGLFEADLPFSVSTEENVLIQIMDLSARDGGIVHLSSTSVVLMPGGVEDIKDGPPPFEQLQILSPSSGAEIEAGQVLVEGFGLASFENTLVVEVYDVDGVLAGSAHCMTSATEPGEPGWFSVELEYNSTLQGPARISVVDPLPVFDGIGHVVSVPVVIR